MFTVLKCVLALSMVMLAIGYCMPEFTLSMHSRMAISSNTRVDTMIIVSELMV
jgi:hypothetical protein